MTTHRSRSPLAGGASDDWWSVLTRGDDRVAVLRLDGLGLLVTADVLPHGEELPEALAERN